ncbi:Zn-ribbon domain-containing OB-fold protein [Cupriavidus sp. CuC1]|uniref:Zn-ribbon domain-containing OB-fold protein n=1 Tax=Cupriavidus sp. CuC1 TaxID=3373131 RepID=UPI0037CE6057
MSNAEHFEVELTDVYHYRLSYGGQSPFFRGLEQGQLIASRCAQCGFVWLPLRPICSKCYEEAAPLQLSGGGEILTSIVLPEAPAHLKALDAQVASALVKPDGSDTCIKAFVVSKSGRFARGTRVSACFLAEIRTIADFYFIPEEDD